jgi:hypothetical protein
LLLPADELADVPELLDVTEELLLESVEELDFAEEELFVDEDETLPPLLLDLSSLLLQDEGLEPSWLSPLRVSLDDETSANGSEEGALELSSQAVKVKNANRAQIETTFEFRIRIFIEDLRKPQKNFFSKFKLLKQESR